MKRRDLRALIFAQALNRCEWPTCLQPATELAHIKSVGMGGSRKRDTISNVFAACPSHARVSDGLPPPGEGLEGYRRELALVLYPAPKPGTAHLAKHVHEALTAHLRRARETRGFTK